MKKQLPVRAFALIKAAKKEATHEASDTLLACAPAFYLLNQKGWTWTDIHRRAVARGLNRTKASLVNATRTYAKGKKLRLK